MELIFQDLQVDGQSVNLRLDFANAGTRAIIKILHAYPDTLECAFQNLKHYEAFAGMNPEVKDTTEAVDVLKKVMGK